MSSIWPDLLVAAMIIGAIVAIWYGVTHHKPPVTPSPKDLTNTVTAGLADAWATVKADLPGIISAEVAQLRIDNAALQAAVAAGEAKYAAAEKAHNDALAQVAARVSAAVAASPELPSQPAVMVPAPDFPVAPRPS